MALSEEAILQQINVLTTKTAENAEMIFKSIPALNKGLNPEYFKGNDTKIVNAINKLAAEVDVLNEAVINMITKVNNVLMDTNSTANKEEWEETQQLMGEETIIEGIKAMLEGKLQDKLLQLDPADKDKLLSVVINTEGVPEVKPVAIDSLTVEVGSYDVSYANRDFKQLNSVGEAIDHILDDIKQPKDWNQLVNVPKIADELVIEENELVLKSIEDDELSTIPITNDIDIDNIINSLDD